MKNVALHQHLLHVAGSRRALNTPVLVLDRDALARNIARMAARAAAAGVALRPHAKTHKSADIARLQLAAGSTGICCAKLGEAEGLAAAGITDILLTSPVVSGPALRRLAALKKQTVNLTVVVDGPANVRALSAAVGDDQLDVLIDIDPGIHRTGVVGPEEAVQLLRCIRETRNLRYRGVQYYCGQQQHIPSFADRRAAMRDRMKHLDGVIAALASHGGAPEIVTGGGTGTHEIDAAIGTFTEWQCGSYVFMDTQYAACDLSGTAKQPFEHALFVDTRVVSANTRGIATVDAGFKSLSTDGGSPTVVEGAPLDAAFVFMGDEHGALVAAARTHAFQLDTLVRVAVPHCDPTVNLYDAYHVVRGDTLIDIWPVTVRGASR